VPGLGLGLDPSIIWVINSAIFYIPRRYQRLVRGEERVAMFCRSAMRPPNLDFLFCPPMDNKNLTPLLNRMKHGNIQIHVPRQSQLFFPRL
jgi:ABC-type molybdenum transport system ATPase subunit/photorepair protein PhrA